MIPPAIIHAIENWCKRHLVDEDPYPYAEDSTELLVVFYSRATPERRELIKREALARLSFVLSDEERVMLSALVSEP